TGIGQGFVPLADLVDSALDTVEQLQQYKSMVTGVATGFVDLDHRTSGLQPTDLIIVAARPSMGKTSFVLNIAQHAALEHGKVVGIFSLEMSREQLFMRMLTGEARVGSHRLRQGMLLERDLPAIAQAAERLAAAPVYIDDNASIGVLEMRAKARRLKAEHGLDMLIIDYLQLMQGRGRFENRQQELTSISRSLKALAKELNVPIVALSQLSRASETRSDHRPILSDLRESGALEQDADVVLFIYREDRYRGPEEETTGEAEIIIAKQRNGPIGTVRLAFIDEYTRFENLEHSGSYGEGGIRPRASIVGGSRATCTPCRRCSPRVQGRRGGPRRRSSASSRPTRTGMARCRWRSRSSRPAWRCSPVPTSTKALRCARGECGRRFSCSARLASQSC